MMTLCSTTALRCWSNQKHIRQRDLLWDWLNGFASLLVTGCANDRQLKALFNYLMIQHGHTPRFTTFI